MSRPRDACVYPVCNHSLSTWILSVTGVSGHQRDRHLSPQSGHFLLWQLEEVLGVAERVQCGGPTLIQALYSSSHTLPAVPKSRWLWVGWVMAKVSLLNPMSSLNPPTSLYWEVCSDGWDSMSRRRCWVGISISLQVPQSNPSCPSSPWSLQGPPSIQVAKTSVLQQLWGQGWATNRSKEWLGHQE